MVWVGPSSQRPGITPCQKCSHRLEKSAGYAADNGFDYFTTTLSISPYKNAEKLNSVGDELGRQYNVKYLFSDFKKKQKPLDESESGE